MKRVHVISVGAGLIGGTTIGQILEQRAIWRSTMGLDVVVAGVIGTGGGFVAPTADGFGDDTLRQLVTARRGGATFAAAAASAGLTVQPIESAMKAALAHGPSVALDTSTGTGTLPLARLALEAGAGLVLSNKAPLAMPIGDSTGDLIWANVGPNGMVRYETTCGAGLPVISTLRALIDSGDEIREIMGTVSGTFGAIFSRVAAGEAFSAAVAAAKDLGYTEPDPRDDLSGLDVARKALILARTMGRKIDLGAIAVESLVPAHLQDVSVPEFMSRISDADVAIGARAAAAKDEGKTLKYVCAVTPDGPICVGLAAVSTSTVLGALQGPENIISIRSKRYDAYPLNITGPGAGAAVTAAGVVADLLALANGPIGD